jgi:hypothetical protein
MHIYTGRYDAIALNCTYAAGDTAGADHQFHYILRTNSFVGSTCYLNLAKFTFPRTAGRRTLPVFLWLFIRVLYPSYLWLSP